jgi:hypothetical protein
VSEFQGPYRTEIARAGCPLCGAGKTWDVIGPDDDPAGTEGIALSRSFCDEDGAEWMVELLNAAWRHGRAHAKAGL